MSCGTIKIETSSTDEVLTVGIIGPQGPQGVGVPTGGITGYVLAKASDEDYDTEWIFNSGGGGADLSNPPPIGDVTPNTGDFTNLTAVTASLTTAYVATISASGTATLPHIHGSIAGNLYIHVKNTEGGALSRGTPVYIKGNVGDTDRVEVGAADFDDAAKMPAIGLLEQDLENNGSGDAVIVGELDAANTAAFALNQEVFVGNAGAITGSRPTTGQVQSVGTIARVQQNSGVIVVNMQSRRTPDESFAAATHAASHAAGGSDAINPSDINAQSITTFDAVSYSTDQTLPAARSSRLIIDNTNASGIIVKLPTGGAGGTLEGDTYILKAGSTFAGPVTIQRAVLVSPLTYLTIATLTTTDDQYSFRANSSVSTGAWDFVGVDNHTHTAADIDSGASASGAFLQSNGSGGASWNTVSYEDLDDVPSSFPPASHTHELNALDATGATDGHVLTADGAGGAAFEALPASGVSAIGTSAADILSVSGSDIVADDAGADRIVFWDDSESKLAYGTPSQVGAVASDPSGVTGADAITNIMSLTTAEYAAIGSPDAATLYLITDP